MLGGWCWNYSAVSYLICCRGSNYAARAISWRGGRKGAGLRPHFPLCTVRPAPCPRHYGPGRYTLRAFLWHIYVPEGTNMLKNISGPLRGSSFLPYFAPVIRKGPGRSGVHLEAIG